jgi:hypothetical protein
MATAQEVIDALAAEVAEDTTIMESATTLINGISDRITAAVAAALAGGATAAQLAPLTDLAAALDSSSNKLRDAVSANTPAA